MKIKYLISLCLIVLFLMSVAGVSASEDTNQTGTLGVSLDDNFKTAEYNQEIIGQTHNEVELKENENTPMYPNILATSNEEEIIGNSIYVEGNTFKNISDAIDSAQAGDTIYLNGTYKNNNHGHIKINKAISIIGEDNTILDAEKCSRIFYVTSYHITIQNITFINGKADYGGAIYFKNTLSFSNINASFINNTATRHGGANYFRNNFAASNIGGTYINNTATEHGGANFFYFYVDKSNIDGTYINNTATRYNGGANCFNEDFLASNITGTYINNKANGPKFYDGGGANYFQTYVYLSNIDGTYINNTAIQGGANFILNNFYKSNITGTYINNTAENFGINTFHNHAENANINGTYINNKGRVNFFLCNVINTTITGIYINNSAGNYSLIIIESPDNANISNAIFLNNKYDETAGVIFANKTGAVAENNWFGNNATNYKTVPKTTNIQMNSWLFLNATADPNSLLVSETSAILFKLYSYDNSTEEVSDYDNSKMPPVNLSLTAANGDIENTTTLNKSVEYIATKTGQGSVTAEIENAECTVFLNNRLDPELSASVNPKEIDYGENASVILEYNATATGTVNITLTGKKHTQTIENVDLNNTIQLPNTILPDEYEVSVSYFGDEVFTSASAALTLTVNQIKPDIKVAGHDINVTDVNGVMFTVTLPENATGNLTISNGITLNVTKEGRKENNSLIVEIMNDAYPLGQYNWTFTYSDDDIYENSEAEAAANILIVETSITANATSELFVDDTYQITYNLTPGDAVGNIKFTSNDTGIAEVDQNGNVKAVGEGTALITLTFEGSENYTASSTNVTVTVRKIATEITLTNESIELKAHQSIGDLAALDPADAGNLTYKSSNEDIILVSEDGIIYAQVKGTATVTVSFTGDNKYKAAESKNITVTVTLNEAKITVNNDTLNLKVDETFTITATTEPKDLNVTYTPDDSGVYTVDENGVVTALKEGTGSITLSVGDNEVYDKNTVTVSVTVSAKPPSKENLTIHAAAEPIIAGENATVKVTGLENATGEVSVIANGKTCTESIKDGEASIIVPGLTENTTAIVNYAGDDTYNPASTKVNITVNPKGKENATITIDAPAEADEGDNVTVTVTLPEDASGTVKIGNEAVPVQNGTASALLTDLPAGNITVPVTYSGDDKYNPIETEVNITVNEDKTIIVNAPDLTKYYGGSERFVVTVTDYKGDPLENKTVKININGKDYTRTTKADGTASIALNLNSGTYKITTRVDNDTVSSIVTVKTTVNGTDLVKVFRNATQFYATFKDSEGNYLAKGTAITFNINGVFYNRTVEENGLAKLNINLAQGTYIITSMNTVTGENAANNVTVIARLVENKDLTKYYRNSTQYTVKVIGDDGKPVGAGETVTFNINGVLYNRTTNESGMAKLNINLQSGDYIITAEYNGCTVSNKIKVLPVLTAKDITMKYRDGTKFVATLVDGQGKPYEKQSVQFNINGIMYNRVTDASGQAKLNINLLAGQYIITSSYNGANIANKITIRG